MRGRAEPPLRLRLDSLIAIVYQPILQFWFLYVLFFCQIVAAAFGCVFVVNVVLAIVMMIAPPPFDYPMIKPFAATFPFFVVGMIASKILLSRRGMTRTALPLPAYCCIMRARLRR